MLSIWSAQSWWLAGASFWRRSCEFGVLGSASRRRREINYSIAALNAMYGTDEATSAGPPPHSCGCKTGWPPSAFVSDQDPTEALFGHHAEGQKVPAAVIYDRDMVSLLLGREFGELGGTPWLTVRATRSLLFMLEPDVASADAVTPQFGDSRNVKAGFRAPPAMHVGGSGKGDQRAHHGPGFRSWKQRSVVDGGCAVSDIDCQVLTCPAGDCRDRVPPLQASTWATAGGRDGVSEGYLDKGESPGLERALQLEGQIVILSEKKSST